MNSSPFARLTLLILLRHPKDREKDIADIRPGIASSFHFPVFIAILPGHQGVMRWLRHAAAAFLGAALLTLPVSAKAESLMEQVFHDIQCSGTDWERCKQTLEILPPEEQYSLAMKLRWRYGNNSRATAEIRQFLIAGAAVNGHFRAQYDLAGYYEHTKKDLARAAEWYDKAARNQGGERGMRESAANRAERIRKDPLAGWVETGLFILALLLCLSPILLEKVNMGQQALSLVPNAFNGLVFMSWGQPLKHPYLLSLVAALPIEFTGIVMPVVFLIMYGVLLMSSWGGRYYITANAVVYLVTITGAGLMLLLLGGMASQGAGR